MPKTSKNIGVTWMIEDSKKNEVSGLPFWVIMLSNQYETLIKRALNFRSGNLQATTEALDPNPTRSTISDEGCNWHTSRSVLLAEFSR